MKRIELSTVSTSQKSKKVNRKQQTYRFNVVLLESTAETCPEYSFLDFVKNHKRGAGNICEEPDDQSEVVAIAQRFEAKYGPKGLQSGTKKRTQEMDDFYDPGGGYDEDDPFIDNTEAYDEVIPATLTNQHGGFCINRGRLDFKDLNDDPWDRLKAITKRKKVRVLDPESEDETGITLANKCKSQKRKRRLENKEQEDKRRQPCLEEGVNIPRKSKLKLKKPATESPYSKDVINSSLHHAIPAITAQTPAANIPAVNKGVTETTTNGTADVTNETAGKDELSAIEVTFNAVLRESLKEDSSSKSEEHGKGENHSAERNTPLPSQLPPHLLEAIENMKHEAKETKEKKFFTAYINKLLLDIELGSHKLPWGSKTAIYSHLSEHLPYGKYTLQRRAKKLRESQEKDQLKGPILMLREAIGKVMPALVEQHDLDVQKAKMSAEALDEIADVVKEEMSTESEGEEKSESRKKPRCPRRKFQWNTEIRDLLLGIVSTKMKHFSSCKTRSQTAEEYLKAYLDSDIKPQWPHGWMQTRMLLKESKKAHEDVTKGTLQSGKQRKVPASLDTAQANETTHVSRTEDVIEVSSFVENCDKNTVIINLPNSVASMSQVYQTSLPSPSVTSGDFGKESFKVSIAVGQGSRVSSSSVSPAGQQKVVASNSLSVQDVVAVSLQDSPRVSLIHGDGDGKFLNPVLSHSGTLTSGAQGLSLAVPSAQLNIGSRSFSETLDELNNNGSTKLDPSSPSSNQQQQLRHSTQQFNSNQHKLTVTSQKPVTQQQQLITHAKQSKVLSQEVQNSTNSHQYNTMARASSNMIATTDAPNSSWSNLDSVVQHKKLASSSTAGDRIHQNKAQKLSTGVKTSNATQQQNHTSPPNQQELKTLNTTAKPNQIIVQKNHQLGQLATLPGSISQNSDPQFSDRTGVPQATAIMSSKEDSRNQAYAHYQDLQKAAGQSSPQLKTVTGTSNLAHKFSPQQLQNIKTGTVIATSTALQLSSRTAADFSVWASSKPGNIKQPSPPRKAVPLTANVARSSLAIVSSLGNKQPGAISHNVSAAQNVTSASQATSLPSLELVALSPYEQMKTRMQQQEAIEGQALKNLAMAVQLGGSSHSALFDQDGDNMNSKKMDAS